jgi:hypothetical protein
MSHCGVSVATPVAGVIAIDAMLSARASTPERIMDAAKTNDVNCMLFLI